MYCPAGPCSEGGSSVSRRASVPNDDGVQRRDEHAHRVAHVDEPRARGARARQAELQRVAHLDEGHEDLSLIHI